MSSMATLAYVLSTSHVTSKLTFLPFSGTPNTASRSGSSARARITRSSWCVISPLTPSRVLTPEQNNMLIRPTPEQLADFGEPDFIIYNAGQFPANRFTKGMSSTTSVEINFKRMEMVILGTEYAGEMKKGVFSVMHYLQPVKFGQLSLHSSANVGNEKGDVTLFFGLSGTGKTTLSADPNRALIGDDEHVWSDTGVFNIEGGCYAKTINLSAEKEPEIFNAIRFGAILENVVYNPLTREPDYDDVSITENTRCAYPIDFIPNARIPSVVDRQPSNIIMLTCDAFGVLPPVSKLTPEQASYHFLAGYTSYVHFAFDTPTSC